MKKSKYCTVLAFLQLKSAIHSTGYIAFPEFYTVPRKMVFCGILDTEKWLNIAILYGEIIISIFV